MSNRSPIKTGDEHRYSGRVGSSCSTNGNYCVILVTNQVISHERRKAWVVSTTKSVKIPKREYGVVNWEKDGL